MVRGARGLLLLAICAVVAWVAFSYVAQRKIVDATAPERPNPLPAGVSSSYQDWRHVKRDDTGRVVFEILAKGFKQEKDTSRIELEGVRIHLMHKDGSAYDRVESPFATYQPGDDLLYADSEVRITLAVPTDAPPSNRLVSIHTSGVTFDSKTNRASTDRPADFVFERGTGKCIGADYDPNSKELTMRSSVELNLDPSAPGRTPMKLEAGRLIYKELHSQILLSPWAKLTRGASVLEGADTVVNLTDGAIQGILSDKAKGVESDPKRRIEYSAARLNVQYSPEGAVDKVWGEPDARMISETAAARTTIASNRLDLDFESQEKESILKTAQATGKAVVESQPLAAAPGRPMPDTRVLRSEVIAMKMRPDGKEIEEVFTSDRGYIDFIPNHASSRRRKMEGERIYIKYGDENRIKSFRSVDVTTRTEPAKKGDPPMETRSKDLLADFDPATGQMTRMRQWNDFRYDEGERHATALQGMIEQPSNVITLETKARVWDPSGSTTGDTIRLEQDTGAFTATGHVASSRLPDQKPSSSGGLLSSGEPIQAKADKMTSTKSNTLIVYEGKADMWQGANRVRAKRIEIDRAARRLTATGDVETQLVEKDKKAAGRPVFTIVKAANLVYTEADRLAHYTGGAVLTRPELHVKSTELRSYLSPQGSESSLDRAFADGKVEIRQTAGGRIRDGASEHAEYYVTEQRIVLHGGEPRLTDSVDGTTTGEQLTYYAGDDRLIVNGAPQKPAKSILRRK